MAEKPRLERQAMCDRLAMEFQDGWIVNLGVGMPTLCSNYVDLSREIIFHSENGVIGYGPLAPKGQEDKHLVNAGGQNVTAMPGMAIVHHADSFAFTRKGGGIGGAMDLAACAKRVFIALEHTTREGKPRMLKRCQLPVTAPGVVKLVATDLGLFEVTPQGFKLREYAPGWTPEDIQELTEARLIIADDLHEFRL